MKFKLLSIGQKFEYKGEAYVKTSALIASNVQTSHNKMIPAYAMLTLLDNTGIQEQQVKNTSIDAEDILKTFNLFYATCISTLEQNNVLVPLIKDELDKARDEFTQQLIQ